MNFKLRRYKIKENRGITLLALIVTIIVLLILAGVSISILTGDNGIINKSGDAKNATEISNEKEELEVAVIRFSDKRGNLDASKIVNGLQKEIKNLKEVSNTNGKFPVKVEYKNGHKYQITTDGDIMMLINAGDTAPSDSNVVYSSGNYTAIIPAGFTVSATESSIENGLVVTDGTTNQNEWVWIPVSNDDLEKMYVEDSSGWTMKGTSVNTQLKSRSLNEAEEIATQKKLRLGTRNLTRGNPGEESIDAIGVNREPDVLSGSKYEKKDENREDAGFIEEDGKVSSLETMATKLKNDYKDMIDSVRKNKGFYIGRYELGKDENNNLQVKSGLVINYTNWFNLYSACKSFSNENVQSRMIWGCQWDQVCRFINEHGNKVNLDDSTNYGNYNSSSDSNITTGNNLDYKTNNIYDLAGNCWEWTQEASTSHYRCVRGRKL